MPTLAPRLLLAALLLAWLAPSALAQTGRPRPSTPGNDTIADPFGDGAGKSEDDEPEEDEPEGVPEEDDAAPAARPRRDAGARTVQPPPPPPPAPPADPALPRPVPPRAVPPPPSPAPAGSPAPAARPAPGARPAPAGAPSPARPGKGKQAESAAPTLTHDVVPEVVATEAALRQHIEARSRYVKSGDRSSAEIELSTVLELKEELGARNIPLASNLLIRESTAAIARRDLHRAALTAEIAARLSPDIIATQRMRLRAALAYGLAGVPRAVGISTDMLKVHFQGFRNQVTTYTTIAVVIGSALLVAIGFFALILLLRHLPLAGHDIAKRMRADSDVPGLFAAILIGLIPPILGFGLLPTIVVWLALTLVYQSKAERIVSLIGMGLLATVPFVLALLSPLVFFHGSTTDDLAQAFSETFTHDAEARLVDYAKNGGERDFDVAMALAMRARMRGDLAESERWYRAAVKIQPSNVIAQTNLGNVLFFQRKVEPSLEAFRAAGRSQRAEPWLNLASVLLDQSRFEEAKTAIEEARKYDPELAKEYNTIEAGTATARKLIDIPLDRDELWGRLYAEAEKHPDRDRIAAQLWSRLAGTTPPLAMPILTVVAALTALFGIKNRRRLRLSAACTKCGVPAPAGAPDGYCEACQAIFVRGGVDPDLREKKDRRIRLYQTVKVWVERVMSPIAGAGWIFTGQPVLGIVVLLVFLIAGFHIFWLPIIGTSAWSVASFGPTLVDTGLAWLIAVVLGAVSVRKAFR